ncbi:hypothetical protein VPHD51_0147 [Vibrio phage D51]
MFEIAAIVAGAVTGVLILIFCFWECTGYPDARDLRPVPPRPRNPNASRAPPRPQAVKYSDPLPKVSDTYKMVGCPECGQPHRYGLDRDFLDCYACSKTFSPRFEGRKYVSYRKEKQ